VKYPKISIVTPSYNQGKFIEGTILSVLNQNYPNLEYIIVDGGSTDNSVEIIKKYQDRISYWVSEKDRGQSHAVNKGFKRATGDIIGWLNSDDTYLPHCLKHVEKAFSEHPDADAVYGNIVYTDENSVTLWRRYVPRIYPYEMLLFYTFGQPAVFFKRRILGKIGYVDETLKYTMDQDFFLRMKWQCKMIHINRFLATCRLQRAMKTLDEKSSEYSQECEFTFNKNKIRKFKNKKVESIYYGAYYFLTIFQRFCAIIKGNLFDYMKYKDYKVSHIRKNSKITWK